MNEFLKACVIDEKALNEARDEIETWKIKKKVMLHQSSKS
jgi:hypothetical protein